MDEDSLDYDNRELLDDLVSSGLFKDGSSALGVAKQVLGKGLDSLSAAQRQIFDRIIGKAMGREASIRERRENLARVSDDQ